MAKFFNYLELLELLKLVEIKALKPLKIPIIFHFPFDFNGIKNYSRYMCQVQFFDNGNSGKCGNQKVSVADILFDC